MTGSIDTIPCISLSGVRACAIHCFPRIMKCRADLKLYAGIGQGNEGWDRIILEFIIRLMIPCFNRLRQNEALSTAVCNSVLMDTASRLHVS